MNWFPKPLASGRKGMPWESGDTEAACGLGGPELCGDLDSHSQWRLNFCFSLQSGDLGLELPASLFPEETGR